MSWLKCSCRAAFLLNVLGIPLKESRTNARIFVCSNRQWLKILSVLVKDIKPQIWLVSLMVLCIYLFLKSSTVLFSWKKGGKRVYSWFYLTDSQIPQVYIDFILVYHFQNVIMSVIGINGPTSCQYPMQNFHFNRK